MIMIIAYFTNMYYLLTKESKRAVFKKSEMITEEAKFEEKTLWFVIISQYCQIPPKLDLV